jgi:hypothetical protein
MTGLLFKPMINAFIQSNDIKFPPNCCLFLEDFIEIKDLCERLKGLRFENISLKKSDICKLEIGLFFETQVS